jgi:hypothetical protein
VTQAAVDIVQRQLDAYNARDLDRFLANFSEDITVYRLPSLEPNLVGKPAFAQFYASQRFNLPTLRAELVNRIVLGSKVIDHERIFGVRDAPFEMAVAYHVAGGKIERMWALTPD